MPGRLPAFLACLASVVLVLSLRTETAPSARHQLWSDEDRPAVVDTGPDKAAELGVKWRTDVPGTIVAVRFYKSRANTGPHPVHLWTTSGQLLASATATRETAEGWQVVPLSHGVTVVPRSTYVVSYHAPSGHYSFTSLYFTSPRDSGPLHAPAAALDANGVFVYGVPGTFPTGTFNGANYWVDPVFVTAPDRTPPALIETVPPNGAAHVSVSAPLRAMFSKPLDPGTVSAATVVLTDASSGTAVPGAVTYDDDRARVAFVPARPLTFSSGYVWTLKGGGTPSLADVVGNPLVATESVTFTTNAAPVETCPCTLFGTRVPDIADAGAENPVEVGLRFRSDVDGDITAVRFYKSPANTGPHEARLWGPDGVLLARAPFTHETASGWQTVAFASPVAIQADAVYVASYTTTVGHYSFSGGAFAAPIDAPPLHIPRDGDGGANGVYRYGGGTMPASGYRSTNYWVDVTFVRR